MYSVICFFRKRGAENFDDKSEDDVAAHPSKKVRRMEAGNEENQSPEPDAADADRSCKKRARSVNIHQDSSSSVCQALPMTMPSTVASPAADECLSSTPSFTHFQLDFLQSDNVKDKQGRRPAHQEYDSRTLQVHNLASIYN